MIKRPGIGRVLALVLALIIVPVLVTQILPDESRQYEWVSLDETLFSEVRFRNTRQNLDLGGMLFVPPGDGPFPAAVIIHGSGTSRRDSGWYLTLTAYLQRNGVAVLLPDKRGSEKSGGTWRTADFHDLATDTIAAIEFLENQQLADISMTGVIGMSQGGWIAPIVASEADNIAFVVNMVGSAVTPVEQLAYEENLNLRQIGFLPGISNLIALFSTAHIRHVAQADFWDGIADYDPLPYWRETTIPVLVLYGADDTNVPSAESAARLQSLGMQNIEIRMFERSGHALQDPAGQGDDIIRKDALDASASFIKMN
jgi:dipeptidyl aminopeptidase/acylaminoacyl peptidase